MVKRCDNVRPTGIHVTGNTHAGGQRMCGRFAGIVMTPYPRTTGDGFDSGVVELANNPGCDGVTFAAIHGSDKNVVWPHTRGVNTVMAIFTGLAVDGAVVKQFRRADAETFRCVATLAGRIGGDMQGRLANGKYVIVAALALGGKFFEQTADMALFAVQAVVFAV